LEKRGKKTKRREKLREPSIRKKPQIKGMKFKRSHGRSVKVGSR